MAEAGLIQNLTSRVLGLPPILTLAVSLIGLSGLVLIYRTYLDNLRSIPGPLICRLTSLWSYYHSYMGDEVTRIDELHQKYGPVVRIGPNEVVISDGLALAPIYTDRGGFLKAPCYANFDSEGFETIFSTLSPDYRKPRSKAVMPLFSTANIRAGNDLIETTITKFVDRLKKEADLSRKSSTCKGEPQRVNVLNLSRSVALDTVSTYLFGNSYDAIVEGNDRLSAASFVDFTVAFGRFFFLPNWLFLKVMAASEMFFPDKPAAASLNRVNDYTIPLVSSSDKAEGTFQGRLLKAGISAHETEVEIKDLIFAGTDSTGTNIATIIWNLAKEPRIYQKLRDEIAEAEAKDPSYIPATLPYLDAVVHEGLRVSMANPTRLPRVVPPAGFPFTTKGGKQYFFPGGTVIGCQIGSLHFNPTVYPNPREFIPERWIDDPTPEMYRDWFPFGLGSRQCIARNLAMEELILATRALAKSNVLEGAKAVGDRIEILEWFNSKIVCGSVDLVWE